MTQDTGSAQATGTARREDLPLAVQPPGEALAVTAELSDDEGALAGRLVAKMGGKPAATARILLERQR